MREVIKENMYRDGTAESDIQKKWWTGDPKRLYETIWPLVNSIRTDNSVRHVANIKYYNMYANQALNNLSAAKSRTTNTMGSHFGESSQLTYNVVKSCIDSARSKISKERPRPYFLTEKGSYQLQKRAQKLNDFIVGLFDGMGQGGVVSESLYNIGSECFLDACITGTGTAKMYIKDSKVVCERFISDELIIDQFEGCYRTPRSAHQVKYIDREVLKDLYPEAEHRYAIENATAAQTGNRSETQDMIPVVESYHLPSGKDADDGIRTITIQTGTLKTAKWTRDYFPFLVQRWSLRPVGFYGIGLAEELQGIQREINNTLSNIQTGLRRIAVPRAWCHISDHSVKKKMTNKIGEINYYKETPPTIVTPQAFNAETYNHVDRLFAKAYEITGISQLSASSQKPSGITAGIALRNMQEIESERFSTVHKMYQDFFVPQATYMALDFLDELLESGVDTTVIMKDGMTQQEVKYSEVRIDREDFTVKAYPTAFLPTEPAGKFAAVQEGVEAGFFSQEEALELLDFPDLGKVINVKTAVRRASFAYVEDLIDKAKYSPVEPYADMQLIGELCQSYYLEGRTRGMPEKILKILRRVMKEIETKQMEMQQKAEQQQMEQQAALQAQELEHQGNMLRQQQEIEQAIPAEVLALPAGNEELPPEIPQEVPIEI
jgi:hypothetical protein